MINKEDDWRINDTENLKQKIENWRKTTFYLLYVGAFLLLLSLFYPFTTTFWLWLLAIVLAIPWYLTHSLKMIRAWENGVLFWKGKPTEEKGPGWILTRWPLETIRFVKMYERKLDIPSQQVLVREKIVEKIGDKEEESLITITIEPVFYFRITNATNSITAIENVEEALAQLFVITMRDECAQQDLDTLASKKDEISKKIHNRVTKEVKDWGVEIKKAGLATIQPPADIMGALHKVFVAEKGRKATIINADAEKQRIVAVYSTLEAQDKEKIWRALEAFEKLAEGKGTTIVVGGLKSLIKEFLDKK